MRPLKLTVEGFNSFVDEQVADFEAAGADNLFCVAGPTGSGKTSLLDGMILSLYPAHSERGNIVDYVNLRRDSARLTFAFELCGEIFTTERIISRKGKNSFLLSRGGEPLCEGSAAFAFLRDKIGLEVNEFTNVVVLQQGEFAKFLKAGKRDRLALIAKLFDLYKYNDLYTAFNARAGELRVACEAESKFLESVSATDESVAALTERVDALSAAKAAAEKNAAERRAALDRIAAAREAFLAEEKIRAELVKLRAELADAEARLSKGEKLLAELIENEKELAAREKSRDGLVRELALIEEGEKKAAAIAARREKLAADKAELARGKEELAKAGAALAALAETRAKEEKKLLDGAIKAGLTSAGEAEIAAAIGDCGHRLDEAAAAEKNAVRAAENNARTKAENDKLLAEWANFGACHARLIEEENAARIAAESAAKEYESAADRSAAARLAAGLKRGDRCPVCGGIVEKTSAHCEEDDLAALKKRRDDTAADYAKASRLLAESKANLAAVTARKENAEKRMAETGAEEEEARKKLAAYDLAAIERKRAALNDLAAAAAALSNLAARENEAKAAREKRESELTAVAKAVAEREGELAEEEKGMRPPDANRANDLRSALAALTCERAEMDEKKRSYSERLAELDREASALRGKIKANEESIKGAPKAEEEEVTLARAEAEKADREKVECAASLAAAAAELARDKKDLSDKKARAAELDKLEKERETYDKLVKLFYRNAFTEFVAAEYVAEFTRAASEKLRLLTGGKYSLEYDEDKGEFFVSDFLAGNIRRSVKTLSGGETFLASLALAIAISEELSHSRSFDFFFIDEGFGTLSPDMLDTTMQALTRLSRDTLVGMITHRGELIECIPSVIKVVPPDGERGSTIE